MSASAGPNADPEQFRTTRWTRVLAARGTRPDAKAALSELCEAYYEPVHAFIRHTVHDVPEDSARDLTHQFFEKLLARPGLDSLEQGRGRFRSYLLGAVKHFLADWRERNRAAKRGGGVEPESLEAQSETRLHARPENPRIANEAVYDRAWALAVLGRAIEQVEADLERAGNARQFEVLKPWLSGEAEPRSQAEAARQLGISEGAVKVAIHRLRKRFRRRIKAEIAQTVESESEIGGELNHLIEALSLHSN